MSLGRRGSGVMRLGQRFSLLWLVSFVFFLMSFKSLEASCEKRLREYLQGAFVAVAVVSSANGGVIDSMSRDATLLPPIKDVLTWPYSKLSYPMESRIQITEGTALQSAVLDAHRRYRDSVFFDGVFSVYNPNEFLADRFQRLKPGDQWVASSGHWNTEVLRNVDRPLGVFGVQVIYDQFLNDPNLWQYTVIDWSNAPWTVEVTHVAWVKLPHAYEPHYESYLDRHSVAAIPSPSSSLLILGGAAKWAVSRRRR
jgi:hypothetical protein